MEALLLLVAFLHVLVIVLILTALFSIRNNTRLAAYYLDAVRANTSVEPLSKAVIMNAAGEYLAETGYFVKDEAEAVTFANVATASLYAFRNGTQKIWTIKKKK